MERRDRSRSRERGEPEKGRGRERGTQQIILGGDTENRPNPDDQQKLAQQEYQKQHAQYQQQQQQHYEHQRQQMYGEWFYVDVTGTVQGPFGTQSMSAWAMAGHFSSTLQIKLRPWSAFHSLSVVFPGPETAFKEVVSEPVVVTPQRQPFQPMQQLQQQQQQQQ